MEEREMKSLQVLASSGDLEAAMDVSAIPLSAEDYSGDSQVTLAEKNSALERVRTVKRISMAKAREENEKTMIENRYHKELNAIISWEKTKMADVEAYLKKYEELLEKKKAEYEERMKNKMAQIHKIAEEKRAAVEAKKGRAFLKAEEQADKYREEGFTSEVPLFVCKCCLLNN